MARDRTNLLDMTLSPPENTSEEDSSIPGGIQQGDIREGGWGKRKRSCLLPTFGGDHGQNKKPKISAQDAEAAATHRRRAGTSGIAGQLYEVKTATLALLNALLAKRRGDIDNFWLGTNVDGVGAADDIVLKYTTRGRVKVIFVQCKHRDNLTKKVNLNEVLKEDGDFSLLKLLDSYFSIMQTCDKGDDDVLKGSDENIEILMYTPAEIDFVCEMERLEVEYNDFFFTNETGNIFKFKDNGKHIDRLLEVISNRHAKQLAKLLANCVLSGTGNELMSNNLIKIYHVYLKNHVLKVSDAKFSFRAEFFKSDDIYISRFRKYLYEQILNCKMACEITKVKLYEIEGILNISLLLPSEKINTLKNKSKENKLFINDLRGHLNEHAAKSVVDKISTDIMIMNLSKMQPITVPNTFGNIDLIVTNERQLDDLSTQFVKILQDHDITSTDVEIRINSKHIGYNNLLTKEGVQISGGIGGLVGNLLILDAETNLLKFDTHENSLPANAKKVLIKLKDIILKDGLNIDLSRYRFQFNIHGFPRLSWNDKADRSLLVDFISKFKFYSSQAKEDGMDNTIKKKMINYYNTDFNIHKPFLEVLHKLQSWWKTKDREVYLTETCNYFNEADKPDLLSTFKFIYTNEINSQDIEFSATALQSLGIENFMKHIQHQILNIITNNLTLSTIKVLQYFTTNHTLRYNFSIIDMKYVHDNNSFNDMLEELRNTHIENIIIKSEFEPDEKLSSLCKEFSDSKKKYFIITEKKLHDIPNYIWDETNTFLDLSQESKTKLLENTRILFQDEEIYLKELLINEECKSLIDVNVLDEIIISKGRIAVGKPLADDKYNTIKDFYIDRKIHCCVHIKKEFIMNDSRLNAERMKNLIIIYSKYINQPNIEQCKDILLISDDVKDFEQLCTEYRNCVHWFQKKFNHYIWKQSRGSLYNIRSYVERNERSGNKRLLKTMADVEDKTVIIAAGPGMGKTSLLTHLSISTKRMCPSTWIVRINLLDYSDSFFKWKNNNVYVDKEKAFSFLAKMITSTNSETPLSIFEKRLFDQYYRSGQVALIFDGYDEISPDYKDQVIELLVNLNTTLTKKMWVTTRPYDIQCELENRLGAFCYALETFSKDNQRDFLNGYCRSQLTLADIVFGYMDPEMQPILATPLHLYMIVKVSQNKNEQLINTISNLHNLYKEFIDIKVEIYIVDKLQLPKECNSSQRRLINKECRDIILNHKILAIAALCRRDELSRVFNEQEREIFNNLIERFKNEEEKTGIVDRFVDDTPRFVHITFAEYFIVEYFCDKLKSGTVSDIICKLLLSNRNIRKFFNSKIANDCNVVELSSNYEFYEKIIESSYDEKRLLLSIAMQENLKYLVKFYSKVIYIVLRENNLHIIINFAQRYRLFEHAFEHNHVSFVSDMLDSPAFENPQRKISGRLELLVHILESAMTCLGRYQLIAAFTSILDKIIRKGYQLEEILLYIFSHKTCDLLRRNLIADNFSILMSILAKLNDEQLVRVATVYDDNGWTLIDNAVKIHKCVILHYLMKRLNKTRFRTISLIANNDGKTPILRLFIELKNDQSFDNDYSSLCKYICPSDDEDEAQFQGDRLRNMYVIAATCKSLFIGNTGWFITRMLEEVQHYCSSINKDDVNFGIKLLDYAISSDNEIIIRALLHNVKDADRFMEIMMAPCDNIMSIVILENIVRNDVNIDLLPLELLSTEQLVQLVCTAKKFNIFINHLNRLNPDQLVQIIIDADFTGRTIIHKAAARLDFIGNVSFTYHLERLSIEQLVKITTVMDDYGWTSTTIAAEVGNLSFFEYYKRRLNDKNHFRGICLKEDVFQPVILRFVRYEIAKKYLLYTSLCEYICPSNDEGETEFNESTLRNMYLIAATCKSLFERPSGWFIKKMLKDIKQYLNSSNGDDIDFGVRLLYYAITCNNESVINTLLEDVTDAGCITNVLIRFIIGKSIFLGHHEINSHILRFKLRSLHYKQPLRVADFIYSHDFSHANEVAKRQKIMLFNILKGRLIKKDFRRFCFAINYQDMLPTRDMLILSLLHNTDTNDDAYIAGYTSLCEYVCPSAEETASDFDKAGLWDMFKIAATCKSLFTSNRGWFMSKMLEEVTRCCNSDNEYSFNFGTDIISYSMQCENESFIRDLFQNILDTERITEIMMTKCKILPCERDESNGETILHYAVYRNISCQMLRLDLLNVQQLMTVVRAVDHKGDTPVHVAIRQKNFDFVYLLKNKLDKVCFRRLCFQFNKSDKTILHVLCDNDTCMEADEECIRTCVSLCEYIFPTDEEGDEEIEDYSHYMCMLIAEYEQLLLRIKDNRFVKNMFDRIIKHSLDSDGIDYYRSNMYMYTARRSGNTAWLNKLSAVNTNEYPMNIVSTIFGHLNVSK